MMSNFEVEIQEKSMYNKAKHKWLCHNFGGYWNIEHKKFFRILNSA
jgi:hypothetical protein